MTITPMPVGKRVLFYAWLLCLFLYQPCFGQNDKVLFHNISEGLSQNTVTSFAQDKYGFLWVGTYYGLNVYDGVNFSTFESSKDDPFSLNNNFIFCLLAGNNDKIWVGTYGGGLNVYDIDENKFTRITCRDKTGNCNDNYVTALFQDKHDVIWIGTEKGGLFVFDPESDTYIQYFNPKSQTEDESITYISSICDDQYGNIWIGAFDEGLSLIEKGNGAIKTFLPTNQATSLPDNTVRSLHKGQSGRLWVGTNKGLREVIKNDQDEFAFSKAFIQPSPEVEKLQSSVVLSLLERDSALWVGTENNGLFCINLATGSTTLFKNNPLGQSSISGNSIWSLYEDNAGILWIGTFLKGISKVDPLEQKFLHTKHVPLDKGVYTFDLVSSFAEDEKGNLWIGSDGGGLVFFDKEKNTYKHFHKNSAFSPIKSNEVVSVLYDSKQNLWVGTWDGGVNLLRKGSSVFEFLPSGTNLKNGLTSNDIHDLFEDSKGRIWISSFRKGIDVYLPEQNKYVAFSRSITNRKLISNKVKVIEEDSYGNIWIGTEESGVQKITLNEDLEVTESKSFFSKNAIDATEGVSINTIFLDSNDKIWVGTTGNGLFRIDPRNDSFTNFSKKDGLPSNMIHGVLEDNSNKIWGSTNVGLFSLDPQTEEVKQYSKADGLQSGGFYKSSALKTANGNLYFGGINGFTVFREEENQLNTEPPKVYITNFEVSDKPYVFKNEDNPKTIFNDQKVKLKYDENDLTFEFKALNYIHASKNQYQFKLENYDENWRTIGVDRIAHYTNVHPGNYTFTVRAANNDGIWTTDDAKLFIHIKTPWYSTILAYFIYAGIFFGILLWGRNNLLSRERLQSQLKLEQIERAKVEEVNEIKTQFFANISHEFKTPLTLIMSPLQSIINKSDIKEEENKIFKIMMRNAKRLHRLISQILDLSVAESGALNLQANKDDIGKFLRQIAISFSSFADKQFILYEINTPDQPVDVYFEKDKMEKVFVNVLSNAFKFTPSYGKICVNLEETEKEVLIKISDTGKGINEEEKELIFERYYTSGDPIISGGTGIGLSLSKQYVELHKGKINVSSIPGEKTVFTIRLKKGKDHLGEESIIVSETSLDYSHESKTSLQNLEHEAIETPDLTNDKVKKEDTVILIVEDNQDLLDFLHSFFENKYTVLVARDGVEGLEKAKEYIPDIIISDVLMPKMDGFELSKKLKENVLTSHIFVIMLTAKSTDENKEEGLSIGVDSYLTKPFNPKLLELRVQNLLNSRKQFKETIINKKTIHLDPKNEPYTPLDEQFLKDIISVIEENMSNPNFKVDDLCRSLGISKSQLYRKMKGLFDQSANEFIRMIRLKRAAQLINQNNLRISEITYKVGFSDLQYFRNSFKKQYGMSPSQYRNHAHQNNGQ